MYPASLIAAFFVTKAIECNDPITQMKLQKMVYFAQGVHLAVKNEPLIKESIEAWKFGPVVPIIYSNYKLYGNMPIADTELVYDLPKDKLGTIDNGAIESLNYTWEATKSLSAESLANWTHKDGSPWKQVYSPNEWATTIPNQIIKDYFVTFIG